jgi:CMP-N-acetylneuraminic acid synthetase
MYAILRNNEIVASGRLDHLFPNSSFPESGEYGDFLEENDVVEVISEIDYNSNTQKLVQCDPYVEGGKVYSVRVDSISASEQKEILEAHIDFELISTDWVDTDTTLSASHINAWKSYRDKLQLLKEYDNIADVTWPEKPVVYPVGGN